MRLFEMSSTDIKVLYGQNLSSLIDQAKQKILTEISYCKV